jgi:dihydroxyacetone kinase phosphotransfer subunit
VIGLVLVAHSAEVVRGVAAMIAQAAPAVPVAGAGGLSEGRLGTNGLEVAAALRLVLVASGDDGVLVFLDLGSASLAAEVALDELEPGQRGRVRLTEAPFVEGAVSAAVAIAGGATLDEAAAAAESAGALHKWPRD